MLRRPNRLWALLVILMSSQALALGLGEIRLDSALNEPLRAEIRLLSATPEELENLSISMASSEAFARYGLDRPAFLSSVNFRIIPSGRSDGNVIRVTSTQPITEPFLTFLVEASWTRGRLLREYTVLLDPPTFAAPPTQQVTESVQPPVRNEPADSGEIRRPAPAPQPAPAPAPIQSPSASADPAPEEPAVDAMPEEPAVDAMPEEPAVDAMSEEPAAESEPEPVVQEPPAAEDFDTASPSDYRVQRGDTLWSIASRYRPDERLTINQTMLAIFEANPDAFADNINVLSAGASLRIPSADEVFRISRAEALAEVQRQNSAWDGGSATVASSGAAPAPAPQPTLELVPPDEDSLSADSSTVADTPEPAEDAVAPAATSDTLRIAEIENLLADQRAGLVVIADNELAALRRELAELRGEEPPVEPVVDVAEDDIAADDEIFVDDEEVAEEPEPVAADDSEAAETSPEPEVTAPAPTPVARQPQQSLVDTILGYLTGIWGMVGAAVIVALGGLLFFARRAARRGAAEDDANAWAGFDEEPAEEAAPDKTSQMPAIERSGETTIVVEEGGYSGDAEEAASMTATMEIPATAGSEEAPVYVDESGDGEDTEANPSLDDTFSSETAVNLDQSDPIAEADFHMAYGLYDQAADLIMGALAAAPDRTDYVAKLCEIYFVWGNQDLFVEAAERFKDMLGGAEDPEWDKTVIMGQQIAGDHELFSEAQGATKAVDLAFDEEGDDVALDMDFDSGLQEGGDDFIDLGDGELADEERAATGLDFSFDDVDDEQLPDTGETGETEVMPAAEALDAAFGEEAAKTAEMPKMDDATAEMATMTASMDDEADSDATGEMSSIGADDATRLASFDDEAESDTTSEIDLDDLGLDLDGLDADDDDSSSLDDTSQNLALGEDLLEATGRNEAIDIPDDDDIDIPDDDDEKIEADLLEATGQTQILPSDFAVETGTGTNIEKSLSEDDFDAPDDAETMLASLDDDDDFDFAKTEALPEGTVDVPGGKPDDDYTDLDLDDLRAALDMSESGDTADQPRDDATVEQSRPQSHASELDDNATVSMSSEDMSDELHDARTMTEVGTKLDLARAYVDMGDPTGARSILEEVLDEGDASQRQQAQRLLDSLPA